MTTTAATTTVNANAKLAQVAANLPKIRQAPEWDNQTWINSEPVKLSDLRGKVVLVEFWTFDCINCQHVFPAFLQWYDRFNDKGAVIISFHDPEFSNERDWNNVQAAVKDDKIKYAVAQDNDFKTWNAYGVNAWPTWFLIDKQGMIRYKHIGEGAYDETAQNIEALIAEQ
jgi:alkyl hydroperoxide reductase subunit AhpC